MDAIQQILLDVQNRLGEQVPDLACVDMDWGQLKVEMPAVKFPCALLDLSDIEFSQTGHGGQVADVKITVTVAHLRPTSSSLTAPQEEEPCRIFGLLTQIHEALHTFTAGDYAPLSRTRLRKVLADSSRECYEVTYQTAYMVGHDTGDSTTRIEQIRLEFH